MIADVGEWAKSWRMWWVSLQPESREGEKLLQVVGSDECWAETKKGGINGFYNVVVSLGWWLVAITTDGERDEFATVLADVVWVMNHMLVSCQPVDRTAKRSHEDVEPYGEAGKTAKRSAFSFSFREIYPFYISGRKEHRIRFFLPAHRTSRVFSLISFGHYFFCSSLLYVVIKVKYTDFRAMCPLRQKYDCYVATILAATASTILMLLFGILFPLYSQPSVVY